MLELAEQLVPASVDARVLVVLLEQVGRVALLVQVEGFSAYGRVVQLSLVPAVLLVLV